MVTSVAVGSRPGRKAGGGTPLLNILFVKVLKSWKSWSEIKRYNWPTKQCYGTQAPGIIVAEESSLSN